MAADGGREPLELSAIHDKEAPLATRIEKPSGDTHRFATRERSQTCRFTGAHGDDALSAFRIFSAASSGNLSPVTADRISVTSCWTCFDVSGGGDRRTPFAFDLAPVAAESLVYAPKRFLVLEDVNVDDDACRDANGR
jgi:hypothetical protein